MLRLTSMAVASVPVISSRWSCGRQSDRRYIGRTDRRTVSLGKLLLIKATVARVDSILHTPAGTFSPDDTL